MDRWHVVDAGPVGGDESAPYAPELPFGGGGVVGAALGVRVPAGASIQGDVVHADQPGSGGFDGGEGGARRAGNELFPRDAGGVAGVAAG